MRIVNHSRESKAGDRVRVLSGSNRVRHVALVPRADRLYVFFTVIGDAPERLLMSTTDMTREWTDWRVGAPVDVMRPETDYECGKLPVAPSAVGD